MTDGGGIAPLLKTLLHYYCSAFYEADLAEDGVRLCDDPVLQTEWDDPAEKPIGTERQGLTLKRNKPALQLANGGIAHMTPDSIAFNMRIWTCKLEKHAVFAGWRNCRSVLRPL